MSMNNLANSYSALGRHPEAARLHEQGLDAAEGQAGPRPPRHPHSMNNRPSPTTVGRRPEAR
ncbi:MAG: tetratricopeptide repeat protein [Gemmataceae bacterium]